MTHGEDKPPPPSHPGAGETTAREAALAAAVAAALEPPLEQLADQLLDAKAQVVDGREPSLRAIAGHLRQISSAVDDVARVAHSLRPLVGMRGSITSKRIDLGELAETAVVVSGPALGRAARCSLEKPPEALMVMGDQAALLDVLMNLLSRAGSAVPDGISRIEVAVGRAGSSALVTVERKAPRESGGPSRTAGDDLDRVVCQHVARLHGGSLLLEERAGFRARLSLPLAPDPPSRDAPTRPPPSIGGRR